MNAARQGNGQIFGLSALLSITAMISGCGTGTSRAETRGNSVGSTSSTDERVETRDTGQGSNTLEQDKGPGAELPTTTGGTKSPIAGGLPASMVLGSASELDAGMALAPETFPREGKPCHDIFAQNLLPTYEVTLPEDEWMKLQEEWNTGKENHAKGLNAKPYHPVTEFRYLDVSISTAKIRLRGNPDFWDPLPGDKMQFQIEFPGKEHRFLGLKNVLLDAATFNRHMLRDRLALHIMRDAGIRAPCANNARLMVNGQYYGVFSNIEKINKQYLKRAFADEDGDLWKRANWELKTNEDTGNDIRLRVLRAATTAAELDKYLDIEQALRVFAAEAVIPDSDGMWAGGLNFYLYDDPIDERFVLLPWDKDNTFERFDDEPGGSYPRHPDPLLWQKPTTHGRPFYSAAIADPRWRSRYIELIAEVVEKGYQPAKLHALIDTWTAQIQSSVFEDKNKPYSDKTYTRKVAELHTVVESQHGFLVEWLNCWQNSGVADEDGVCMMP